MPPVLGGGRCVPGWRAAETAAPGWLAKDRAGHTGLVILILLLIILAIVTGVLGAIIKGAFWLFILTVLFLIGAYIAGRSRSNS